MALGKKFSCFKCKVKFYDLERPEPICPKCGTDQRESPHPDPQEAFLKKLKAGPSHEAPREKVRRAAASEDEEGEEFEEDATPDEDLGVEEEEDEFDFDDEPEEAEEEDYE